MNQIHHTVFNRELRSSFDENILIKKKGTYLLRISAFARSWWQNTKSGRSFLQKDSLTLFINKKQILPTPHKKRLRADDIWNGNILKGHELTTYILLVLDEGNHTFLFDVYGKPYLGELSISLIDDSDIVIENLACVSRDRIPWLTFLIGEDVALSSLSITAKAEQPGKEDDDLRLVIDGITQKNEEKKAHREWYWCGKILKGKSKMFTRSFVDIQSAQRFEFIADGEPYVERLTLVVRNEFRKRIPTVDTPQWTGDFRDDSDQIILARAIFGEGRSLPELGKIGIGWVVRNRIGFSQWGNTYHDVILHPRHFSAFNKNDQNRIFIENPSRDQSQRNAWKECYVISVDIIDGKIPDPTKGANHYYSTYIKPPFWTKGATQTLKVDNTLFYRVPQKAKRAVLPIVFLVFIMIGAGVFALEASRIKPRDFDQESSYFKERIADDLIAVYYGCGTECEGIRVFDEKTGKQKSEFNYGVGYIWSPNKRLVAAFHSSAGHGVTVGDMYGNELLVYTKPVEKNFDIPNVAAWSPDSSKLAVLLHDNEYTYNLFVFLGFDTGIRLTSMRVPSAQTYMIEWDGASRSVSVNDGVAILEIDESGYGHRYSEK